MNPLFLTKFFLDLVYFNFSKINFQFKVRRDTFTVLKLLMIWLLRFYKSRSLCWKSLFHLPTHLHISVHAFLLYMTCYTTAATSFWSFYLCVSKAHYTPFQMFLYPPSQHLLVLITPNQLFLIYSDTRTSVGI